MPRGRVVPLLVALAATVALVGWVATRPEPVRLDTTIIQGAEPGLAIGSAVPAVSATDWLNGGPVTPEMVRGKVVLYDFWTYTCLSWAHTLPYLRAWWDRYRDDGLVIVGIHTPEFRFEHEVANVTAATERLGVEWPVALDNANVSWNAFSNRYWPSTYLADRDGRLRHTHLGEGDYDAAEDALRDLLGVPADAPRADAPGDDDGVPDTDLTPELYLGTERGSVAAGNGPHTYATVPPDLRPGEVFLSGPWTATPQYVEAGAEGATLTVRYEAASVHLVVDPRATPTTAQVSVDGAPPLPVDVAAPDSVRLASHGTGGIHTLTVTLPAGARAYAFRFADRVDVDMAAVS